MEYSVAASPTNGTISRNTALSLSTRNVISAPNGEKLSSAGVENACDDMKTRAATIHIATSASAMKPNAV